MSNYEILDTVKASLTVVLDHRVGLFKAALWPAAAMVVVVGIYFLTLIPMLEDTQNLEPTADVWQLFSMMWPAFLALLPMLLVFMAFSFNWQRYLMLCEIGGDQQADLGEGELVLAHREWWPDFWHYALKNLQLFAALMVPYGVFIALFFAVLPESPGSVESLGPMFMIFPLFGIAVILLYPLMMRAMLVFPAVAAGLPEPTFRNAFDVSRGYGWYMVGAYLLAAFAMQIILMIGMFAFAIIFGILIAIGGNIVAGILGIVFFLLYPVMMFTMMSVYGSVPAFSLMQMIPDMDARWRYFLERRILGDSDGNGGSGDAPPSKYGDRKGR